MKKAFTVVWVAPVVATPIAMVILALASPALGSPGCQVTFRHGGTVAAEQCQDTGNAIAYRQYGGWLVVQKSQLASVADEAGTRNFNPPWTPEEERQRIQNLPKEGGVPVAPAVSEAVAPPPPPPPTVVYVPVPTPVAAESVYQVAAPPLAYPGIVFCAHCGPRRFFKPHATPTRIVPISPSDIGPMAIQKTFPPISPLR